MNLTSEALVLQTSPIITFGYVMQVLLSLGIVLALIYVVGRYLLPKFKISTTGKIIEVLDRVMLEPQVTAYVLRIKKKSWLIVTSNKQVAKIDNLDLES